MRSDIERNAYHNSGTQRFRAIGISFVAPSTIFAYRYVCPILEKVEVRPPATPIFIVPRWVAWGRPVPAARRHWAGGAHPRRILSIGRRAFHTGDVAGSVGACRRGIAARRAHDTHRGRNSRTRHAGSGILHSADAGGEFARCQVVVDFCCHHGRSDRIPWSRRVFGGCSPVRASRNHHSSAATAH